MTRAEFIKTVAEKADLTQVTVKVLLDAIDTVTLEAIGAEDTVPFGFGKIGGKTVASRNGVNPSTGAKIVIPERHGYPFYKASKAAKTGA